jgi:phage terminase small subunit
MAEVKELTGKQKKFCEEYIFDFNASRSARAAGYSEATAGEIGYENLKKPEIQAYIELLQADLSKTAGISRLKVLTELQKIAFSSIAHLHDTWITRKEFDQLSDDQKSSIQEISTQVRKVFEYNPDKDAKEPVEIEFVKVKLYDKLRSLEAINKMLGFDAPKKIEHSGEAIKGFVINPASAKRNPSK